MHIFDCVNLCCCVSLLEFKGKHRMNKNELYMDAEVYVKTLESASKARNIMTYRRVNVRDLGISPDTDQLIHDSFHGVRMCWTQHTIQKVVDKEICKWELKLYTNNGICTLNGQGWYSMPFKHPSTFHMLTLDPFMLFLKLLLSII